MKDVGIDFGCSSSARLLDPSKITFTLLCLFRQLFGLDGGHIPSCERIGVYICLHHVLAILWPKKRSIMAFSFVCSYETLHGLSDVFVGFM